MNPLEYQKKNKKIDLGRKSGIQKDERGSAADCTRDLSHFAK